MSIQADQIKFIETEKEKNLCSGPDRYLLWKFVR